MISRDEIRRLCLEDDKFMAEARESLRMPLIYKDCDNGALAAAPAADDGPSAEPPFDMRQFEDDLGRSRLSRTAAARSPDA